MGAGQSAACGACEGDSGLQAVLGASTPPCRTLPSARTSTAHRSGPGGPSMRLRPQPTSAPVPRVPPPGPPTAPAPPTPQERPRKSAVTSQGRAIAAALPFEVPNPGALKPRPAPLQGRLFVILGRQ